ncbi:Protein of uncharacterised function (DUF1780) [Pseudomonas aeruginosa]|nr:Protein of uncharacterised function (DUF1780) [Pseudomonas aeruginosa]
MNEADYLRLLTRQAEQANDFLSNARKWDRERWVCQRFLEALNVPYRQEDFAAPGDQPPDVLFKGAGFECSSSSTRVVGSTRNGARS